MDGSILLDPTDLERLVMVIDASFKITKRHHFYLWTQGIVQTLLPHDVLFCAAADPAKDRMRCDHFSSVVLQEQDIRRMCAPDVGVVRSIRSLWEGNARQPLLIDPTMPSTTETETQVSTALREVDLGVTVVHGTPSVGGLMSSLFVLARAHSGRDSRYRYMMSVLMPYFHISWMRALLTDQLGGMDLSGNCPLTDRELEILDWVRRGNSNQQIADELHISALTVKNHIQNILRKLSVRNRAEAVAKGMVLDLIRSPS